MSVVHIFITTLCMANVMEFVVGRNLRTILKVPPVFTFPDKEETPQM